MLTRDRALSTARVGLGLASLFNAVEYYLVLRQVADGRYAMPLLAWVPAPSELTVSVHLALAVAASLALVAGRAVVLAACLSTILTAGALVWEQQTYSNHLWLSLALVALLIPAHLTHRRTGASAHGARTTTPPSWPLLLMKVQLSVCYGFAALSKVNPEFLSGVPLAGWVRWDLPAWLPLLLAVATVVAELFLAAGLWFARTRRLAVALGLALHLSIVVMLADQTAALVAFTIICLSVYPLFFLTCDATPDRQPDGPSSVRQPV